MANPIALPGTNVPSGAAVSPGGAQGPSAVSANANNKATLGSDSLVLVQGTAAGVAATTHAQTVSGDDPQLTNARTPTAHEVSHVTGSDQIPLASSSTKGLLNQTSGNTTDFIDGTNNSQPLQPVIWSATRRVFQALGNPTFEIDQRLCGGAATAGAAAFSAGPDRWSMQKAGGTTLAATAAQLGVAASSAVVPGTNFAITSKVLRVTLTGAQATLAAGDLLWITQQIEGPRVRELINDVTSVSVLARTSGPSISVGISLRDPTTTKSLVKLCTIPSSGFALFTFPNIPVFPAGNFVVTPGTPGLLFSICLAAGSTWMAPANDTWQSGNFLGAVGQTNFANLAVNTWIDFAFLQLEPGALCTTPIDCPWQQNYDDALRYFQKSAPYGTLITAVQNAGSIQSYAVANVNQYYQVFFKKVMAKTPTVTLYSDATGTASRVRNNNTTTDLTLGAAGAFFGGDGGFAGYQLSAVPTVNHNLSANWSADTGW